MPVIIAVDIIAAAGCVWLLYSYFFVYPFAFNFQPEVQEHYLYLLVSSCLFVMMVAKRMFGIERNGVTGMQVVIPVVIIIVMLLMSSEIGVFVFSNEYLSCVLAGLQLMYVFYVMDERVVLRVFPWVVCSLFAVEVFIGYWQLMEQFYSDKRSLLVAGTIGNSGIYAMLIVACLPLMRHCLGRVVKHCLFRRGLILSVVLAVAGLVIFTGSRTAMIMLVVFILLSLPPNSFQQLTFARPRLLLVSFITSASVLFFAVAGALLFDFKPASVSGRWFIWKTALSRSFKGNWLAGEGIGSFSVIYPEWQIEAVSELPLSQSTSMVNADESFVAFNEYVQIFAETGVMGTGLILFLLYRLVFHKPWNDWYVANKNTILLISVGSLTSYPLHCNAIIFLLVFSAAAMIDSGWRPVIYIGAGLRAGVAVGLMMCFLFIYRLGAYRQDIEEWKRMPNYSASNGEVLNKYRRLHNRLQYNGKFLLDYGECLVRHGVFRGAAEVLEKSKTLYFSNRTLFALASAHYQAGNCKEAITALEESMWLVPSALTPKYYLSKLYLELGDTGRAREMASLILQTPVKINDGEGLRLRSEMQQLLSQ